MYDNNAVKIYTDGSAMPNPGQGGIGLVIEFPDSMNKDNFELSEGYNLSTNNRMELLEGINAIEWLRSNIPIYKFTRAIIITDSEYLFNNYSNVVYWKKDKWKTKNGKPYENSDLWDLFLKERQKITIHNEIRWEKGKTRPVLKRVDILAKEGSMHPTKIDYGFNAGKFTASRTNSKKAAILFPANGQEIIIRVYRKVIYGKDVDIIYKIIFDEYSLEQKDFIAKYVAYHKKSTGGLKRNRCFKVTFNSDINFPEIIKVEPFEYPKKQCK